MYVQDIPFLTAEQKKILKKCDVERIYGNDLDYLKDFLSTGTSLLTTRMITLAVHLGIPYEKSSTCGLDYIHVKGEAYPLIEENIRLKKLAEQAVLDTANKIQVEAAKRWDAIQKEAATIEIDLAFIKDVANRCTYNNALFPLPTDQVIISDFNTLLKRNKIKSIKTNEKEVLEILLKKVEDNWLFKILTSE